jgi:hypothetical protein
MSSFSFTSFKVQDTVVAVLSEAPAHEDGWGSGNVLNLGARRKSVVRFKAGPLWLQGKSLRYSLRRRLGDFFFFIF